MRGQCLHTKSFCRVMATVEDVDPQFFSQTMGPVRPFSGNEGVDALSGSNGTLGSCPAGDHANVTAALRPPGQQCRRLAQNAGALLDQGITRHGFDKSKTQFSPLVLEKGFGALNSQGLAKLAVVAQFGMNIQWKVGAVDGKIVIQHELDKGVSTPCPRMGFIPKKSVVND